MQNIPFGNYFLLINYIGYHDFISDSFLINANTEKISFPDILLTPSNNEIQTVNIVGHKNFIEKKIDRTIINVDALISNAGSNAVDVLKKSPGIAVDEDGSIRLNSKNGVLVYINDKPTYLSQRELYSYLQSIPAGDIQTIEIMTNPPAKYDAAGNAGIINIRMKRLRKQGLNGNINIAFSQGKYSRSNNSALINYFVNKVNLFAGITYNNSNSFQDLNIERRYYDASGSLLSAFNQNTYIIDRSNGPKLRAGMDYYINKKSTLGFSVSGFRWVTRQESNNNALMLNDSMNITNKIKALAATKRPFYNLTTNVNYNYIIDTTGKEISFNADYLHYNSRLNNSLLNTIYTPNDLQIDQSNLIGHLPSLIDIYTTNGDYTTPFFKTAKIDAGYKISYISTKNNADFFDEISGQLQPNSTFTNHFNYQENINAAYINYSYESKRFGLQAGLRYENTNIKGHQVGDANHPDSSFVRVFNSFFPTLFLSYKIDTNAFYLLNFSYGRRVDRPNYQDMNPFTYPVDRYTLYGGNPYLLPTFSDNFELSFTYKNFLTFTCLYSHVKDVNSETIEQQNGIFFSRPGNIGKQQTYGITANIVFHPIKHWDVNLYNSLIRNEFNANLYGHPFKNSGTTWSINITNQYFIDEKWSAELSAYYNTMEYYAQFELIPTGLLNVAVAKKVLKDKGNIKLSLNDAFYNNKLGGNIIGLNNSAALWRNRIDSRYVTLAFSYTFNKGEAIKSRNSSSADSEKNRVK